MILLRFSTISWFGSYYFFFTVVVMVRVLYNLRTRTVVVVV